MRYVVSEVMDRGFVLGHAVVDTHGRKFTSINLFTLTEATIEVERRNRAAAIKEHWPNPADPEVLAVMESPEFTLDETMTTAYALHRASEIVAQRRAALS